MRFFNILCAVVMMVAAAGPAGAEIVWYSPVTADNDGTVYEDGAYPQTPPLNIPVIAEKLPPAPVPSAQRCAVQDSAFAVAWLASRPHITVAGRKPMVVIVIDDMGVDKRRTASVTRLPGPLTLSYLPYPSHIQAQVDAGRAAGHAIMMHIPMQPERNDIDPGPNVLRADIGTVELARRIQANLGAFQGYTGVNNHMGSLFTQNRAGLDMLMTQLQKRALYFLDSKTHPRSVGEVAAAAAGVPAAQRDVFLDHVETPAGVAAALARTEQHARRYGSAIAIGHPKDVTIAGLSAWLPRLQEKGLELVTLDELIARRRQDVLQAVSMTPAVPAAAAAP